MPDEILQVLRKSAKTTKQLAILFAIKSIMGCKCVARSRMIFTDDAHARIESDYTQKQSLINHFSPARAEC